MISARNQTETNLEMWDADGAHTGVFRDFFLERYAEAFRAEMTHFVEVARGAAPQVSFADSVAALALADAARSSLATGAPVSLTG
jgi:myo-inositol 2-dehydrogenase/D-chiro-inositol 1-dehydrogenase